MCKFYKLLLSNITLRVTLSNLFLTLYCLLIWTNVHNVDESVSLLFYTEIMSNSLSTRIVTIIPSA